MAVILSDSDQVNNSASFSLRLSPKFHQVPLGSRTATVGDEPLRHRPRPFCSVVGRPSWTHHFGGARHHSVAANSLLASPSCQRHLQPLARCYVARNSSIMVELISRKASVASNYLSTLWSLQEIERVQTRGGVGLRRESRRRGHRDLASRCGARSAGRGLFEAGFARSTEASKFRRPADATFRAVEPEHLSRAG